MERIDVAILGAGAAGMMAAIVAAGRGRSVLVIDHADAPGEKIRISGGGRCNFTNTRTTPNNFLSANPHFAKSALARYTPAHFIAMVDAHGIAWHEKALGQLFCDVSAVAIVRMLTGEMEKAGARLWLGTTLGEIGHADGRFTLATSRGAVEAASLVVATGGKSIPKMGATGLGYQIAARFGLAVTETRPGLVPLTLDPDTLARHDGLAGTALDVVARSGKTAFAEAMLFTHRGLSGPAILQVSSYWREGGEIVIDLVAGTDVAAHLARARREQGRQQVANVLSAILPRKLAQMLCDRHALAAPLAELPARALEPLLAELSAFTFRPAGSEGYRTAEVTLGGVDTAGLDSRTMQARSVPGLYFVGECVDVTGWLGGYNFQWAWASGHAAGLVA